MGKKDKEWREEKTEQKYSLLLFPKMPSSMKVEVEEISSRCPSVSLGEADNVIGRLENVVRDRVHFCAGS